LILKPFFLGGIMKGADNRPPMLVPAKGAYMTQDLTRLRDFYQMPLSSPSDPYNTMVVKGTLVPQRLLTAVAQTRPDQLISVSRQLWLRIWTRDEDITSPESLRQALSCAGVTKADAEDLLRLSSDKAIAKKTEGCHTRGSRLGVVWSANYRYSVKQQHPDAVGLRQDRTACLDARREI